jgi:hypothetical protein
MKIRAFISKQQSYLAMDNVCCTISEYIKHMGVGHLAVIPNKHSNDEIEITTTNSAGKAISKYTIGLCEDFFKGKFIYCDTEYRVVTMFVQFIRNATGSNAGNSSIDFSDFEELKDYDAFLERLKQFVDCEVL